jgi:hypothetical protein
MISNEIALRYQNSSKLIKIYLYIHHFTISPLFYLTLFFFIDITSSSAHPGLINTQMLKSIDLMGEIMVQFVKYHSESWEQGAVNVLYPVLCSNINDNGKYFDKCAEREPNKISLDEEMRMKLWDFSVDLLKEKGYI